MKKRERKNRIIARGEHSDHCHVILGDVTIDGKIVVNNSPDYDEYVVHLNEFLKCHKISSPSFHSNYEIFKNSVVHLNVSKIVHIRESHWISGGEQVWTKEHLDIPIDEGEYKYIPQIEFDPFDEVIRRLLD